MRKLQDALIYIVAGVIFLAIIYAVRVAPYGGDLKCLVAECRIVK